jgi:hypothetical protein
MSFAYSPKIVTDGLVFYVDAANSKSYPGVGTTWSDLSKNTNNGTLTNGPTFNNGNGGSIVFDGVNDYVNFGDIINFERTDSFSINLWLKLGIKSVQIIISKWINDGYEIFTINPGKIGWTLANTGGGVNQIRIDSATNTFSNGEIFNLCVTYNGSSSSSGLLMYKNGSLLNTTSIYNNLTANISNSHEFRIGANASTSPLYMVGNTFSSQIYNRVLSSTEILQNYNATKSRFGL